MKKMLFYQMYPIPACYPVWGNQKEWKIETPGQVFKPDRSYGLWEMRLEFEKLQNLGVDCIWLSGALNSPRFDHGYDVMDYMRIDPQVGAMNESIYTIRDYINDVHRIGAKMIIDLVLNHTSTQHPWFLSRRQDYYYWSDKPKMKWANLFDNGSAWKYDHAMRQYYLHLFHEEQADLAWFDKRGEINESLVKEFRRIVKFWLNMGVDGFRLDVPQSINKDINAESLRFGDMLNGNKSKEVINRIFDGYPCLLLMECFDDTFGDISHSYIKDTPVEYVMNVRIKGLKMEEQEEKIRLATKDPGFVLDLESHDSCRFLSRTGMTLEREFELLFDTGAQNVCLFQGQEFGLKNPDLTKEQICELDAQTAMRLAAGESFEELKAISRANARFPLPDDEYERQKNSSELTPFKKFKEMIELWKAT